MKKNYLSAALRLTAALLLACGLAAGGCDSEPTKSQIKSEPRVGILLYKSDDVYISLVAKALRESLAGKAEITLFYAQENQLTQNEQLDKLLAQKVDALAVNMVDTQAAANIVDMAKKADVPVVFFNREPDLNVIKLYNKAAFVGTNTMEAGILQGDLIARLWKEHPEFDRNKDGLFQYIMFQGNADNPEAIARTEYSIKQAREQGVEMRQVGQTYVCNWDMNLAFDAMKVALVMHAHEIEIVVANNDSMALGAITALNELGFNLPQGGRGEFIPAVGVDAIPPAIDAIKNGTMSATVKQDGAAMGQTISVLLLNIINGKNFLESTGQQWDESGVAVRIPYSSVTGGD